MDFIKYAKSYISLTKNDWFEIGVSWFIVILMCLGISYHLDLMTPSLEAPINNFLSSVGDFLTIVNVGRDFIGLIFPIFIAGFIKMFFIKKDEEFVYREKRDEVIGRLPVDRMDVFSGLFYSVLLNILGMCWMFSINYHTTDILIFLNSTLKVMSSYPLVGDIFSAFSLIVEPLVALLIVLAFPICFPAVLALFLGSLIGFIFSFSTIYLAALFFIPILLVYNNLAMSRVVQNYIEDNITKESDD